MARTARLVLPGYPYHVTQRGNYRQAVFKKEQDYKNYLSLLKKYAEEYELSIFSFCLMPNHVHFVCAPKYQDSLANTFKITHMLYAQNLNKKSGLKGHLWQGRFFSSLLDEEYFYAAMHYVENNPVRAGLVEKPWDWKWSSATARVEGKSSDMFLKDTSQFIEIKNWREYLCEKENIKVLGEIRKNTLAGRPSANVAFVNHLEKTLNLKLTPSKAGRPTKIN